MEELAVDRWSIAERYPFGRLLQEGMGIASQVVALPAAPGDPIFETGVAMLGNLTWVFPHVRTGFGTDLRDADLGGAGADVELEPAWVRAAAEAIERYGTCTYLEEDFTVASAVELGDAALDLGRLPRCSDAEYADPRCPLRPADPNEAIRWVRGYSLADRCERYVPAVMSHLYVTPAPAERFWLAISTGVAAHTDLPSAIEAAICEAVERDAIALVWLLRLPLARIELDAGSHGGQVEANLDRLHRSGVEQLFFDATTVPGVPTVYTLQLRDGDDRLAQYVNCATALDADLALAKTIREASPARTALVRRAGDVPERFEDFCELHHGAIRLGAPEWRHAFDFLLEARERRTLAEMDADVPRGGWERVAYLLDRLAPLDTDVVIVDLTPDEVREAGMWVVRAVVPGLMPMSAIHRARYLGHPRLREVARAAGVADVNPLPQPFA